ncbi:MAG: hypothetical protein FWG83_02845 [Oscillospiraceae bacterium]|nr:hypothetical protein [Oscillospiraceae bacterium]
MKHIFFILHIIYFSIVLFADTHFKTSSNDITVGSTPQQQANLKIISFYLQPRPPPCELYSSIIERIQKCFIIRRIEMQYNWYNGENEHPSFQFNDPEQQSSGFDAMNGMDKFITICDKIIFPAVDNAVNVSNAVARHLERVSLSQMREENRQVREENRQLRIENQEIKHYLHEVIKQLPQQSQIAQLPQFAQSQLVVEAEQVFSTATHDSKNESKKSKK